MNMTKALKMHVDHAHLSNKHILKGLIWLSIVAIPVIAHIHLNKTYDKGLATVEKHQDTDLSFQDERIAYLINQGKTFKQLINIGFTNWK